MPSPRTTCHSVPRHMPSPHATSHSVPRHMPSPHATSGSTHTICGPEQGVIAAPGSSRLHVETPKSKPQVPGLHVETPKSKPQVPGLHVETPKSKPQVPGLHVETYLAGRMPETWVTVSPGAYRRRVTVRDRIDRTYVAPRGVGCRSALNLGVSTWSLVGGRSREGGVEPPPDTFAERPWGGRTPSRHVR